ncbi:FtsQ-type POTRA domain-containing protein [Candidatus Pelagibacter sp.]|nr:FtsQ-type POTRA domain-containing protein [Candidatus Pelagibacter sp.]
MLQRKSKKIFTYLFVFLIIGTLTNKNLKKTNFTKISKITVSGLDNKNNFELLNSLNYLKFSNLFFIDQHKIERIVKANNLVEKYSISKKYPSTLDIKINRTIFLAQLKKKNIHFFLGSNGKFIKGKNTSKNVPYIFGDFKIQNFFELKNAIDETNFNYDEVKNLFFFKSGRWDIETKTGIVVKLPKEKIKHSLQVFVDILSKDQQISINNVDLRQHNQIIINGQ